MVLDAVPTAGLFYRRRVLGKIPKATVSRLPRYLRYLESVSADTVSSDNIAEATGASAAQVRKDLSHLGTLGTRGVGYDVAGLGDLIRRQLGLAEELSVAIIGAGNLGTALANYGGFPERRFRVAAVYDIDPNRVGSTIGSLAVRHLGDLAADASREHFAIGIIATPADAAQSVAERLVAAGINSILNFAPTVIKVPASVTVRQVDLATELQILAYYRRSDSRSTPTS